MREGNWLNCISLCNPSYSQLPKPTRRAESGGERHFCRARPCPTSRGEQEGSSRVGRAAEGRSALRWFSWGFLHNFPCSQAGLSGSLPLQETTLRGCSFCPLAFPPRAAVSTGGQGWSRLGHWRGPAGLLPRSFSQRTKVWGRSCWPPSLASCCKVSSSAALTADSKAGIRRPDTPCCSSACCVEASGWPRVVSYT